MRRLTLPTLALALGLAAPSGAADIDTRLDRFELWNGCKPISLVVEELPDDAGKIGLRKVAIEIAVRSRLRGARLYEEHAEPFFHVSVNVIGRAFGVIMDFKRWMKVSIPFWEKPKGMADPIGYAGTWRTGSTGTHGGDAGYILSSVAQHTDKFIDEYLRVNADACRKSK